MFRYVLALTLVASAAAKAARWAHATSGARALAPRLRPTAVTVLTAATLAVETIAAVLVAGPATRLGGALAAALAITFAALLATRRARGVRRMACGCFGGAHERPTLWLAGRALAVSALGTVVAFGWAADWNPGREALQVAAIVALSGAVAVLAALVVALYRQVGTLLLRIPAGTALELASEGPPLGRSAPPNPELWGTGTELVSFTAFGCRLCHDLAPGLRSLARGGIRLVTFEEGAEPRIFAAWRVPGAPYLVVLIEGVVAAKGLVNTLEQAEGLLHAAIARRERIGI